MNWITLALAETSVLDAARIMHCSPQTARCRLQEAEAQIAERRHNIRQAKRIILADGLVRQEISRRAWDEVALGLKRVF